MHAEGFPRDEIMHSVVHAEGFPRDEIMHSVVHAEGFPHGIWHVIMHSVVHAEGFPWTHGSKCLPSISCKKNCLPVETQ